MYICSSYKYYSLGNCNIDCEDNNMKFYPTKIPEVIVIEPEVYIDHRGFFMETYQKKVFGDNNIKCDFVQTNHSHSRKNVLRGLHYQIGEHPQGKLVRVTSGMVLDVAVDIRKNSPTFGKWTGTIISSTNKKLVWIPRGFAHGFYTLDKNVDLVYYLTDCYSSKEERCIIWNDKTLAINWRIPVGVKPILSEKDLEGKLFVNAEVFK